MKLEKNTTIKGAGTLTVEGKRGGFFVDNNVTLTIEGVPNLTAIGGKFGFYGYQNGTSKLIVNGSTIRATGGADSDDYSIGQFNNIELQGDCSYLQPKGAGFNATLKGVAKDGALVKTEVVIGRKYDLKVKNIQVTDANAPDVLGDGKVKYDPATTTLTLNNANIEHSDDVIVNNVADLTITLVGNNTLTNSAENGSGIVLNQSTTINGEGTLTTKGYLGIYVVIADLTIDGTCTVIATTTQGNGSGISAYKSSEPSNLIIKGGVLKATGSATSNPDRGSIVHFNKPILAAGYDIILPSGTIYKEVDGVKGLYIGNSIVKTEVIIQQVPATPTYADAYALNASTKKYNSVNLTDGSFAYLADVVSVDPHPMSEEFDGSTIYRLYYDFTYGTVSPTGEYTQIGTMTGVAGRPTALAYNWTNNLMYVMVISNNTLPQLCTVDLATGVLTLIGTGAEGYITGMDFANDGMLYGPAINTDKLYRINPTTGAVTAIGAIGIDIKYGQDVSFDVSENRLYTYTCGQDITFQFGYYDLTTGAFNPISDVPSNNQIATLVITKPDISAGPYAVSRTPARNATEVNLDAEVSITFNTNMAAVDLSGITITPDPGAVSASVNGNKLTIAHGNFAYNTTYTVTIPAGAATDGTIANVNPITWSFTTTPQKYTVTFAVKDDASNPISGASILINGQTLTTNPSGVATIDLKDGTYEYTISEYGYEPVTKNAEVNGANLDIPITLYKITHMLTLEAEPLEGGTVQGGGLQSIEFPVAINATANSGFRFFKWTWNEDLLSTNASFDFPMPLQDVILTAYFVPETSRILTFTVVDEANNPIPGATVVINDDTYTTAADGKVIIALPDGTHQYTVKSFGYATESKEFTVSADGDVAVTLHINIVAPFALSAEMVNKMSTKLSWNAIFADDMETYDDFIIENIGGYTLHDGDGSNTINYSSAEYPNRGYRGSFIVFNPVSASFTGAEWEPFSGSKYLACFGAEPAPNNDWLITPRIKVTPGMRLSFWAKTPSGYYDFGRFKVGISTTGTAMSDFIVISEKDNAPSKDYVEAPNAWVQYTYDLDAYVGQQVYLAINCISDGTWALLVDDIHVEGPTVGSPAFLTGFDIYLDGALIASDYPNTNYLFTGLTHGEHTLGVQAVYGTEKSEMVTTTINVQAMYTVTFTVLDETGVNPLQGASIKIDGKHLSTDPAGNAYIDLADGTYEYTVSKVGYENAQGTITVNGADLNAPDVTMQLKKYILTLIASPAEGGDVSGGGAYEQGTSVTITATPKAGYKFTYWSEDGMRQSINPTETYLMPDRDVIRTAHFAAVTTFMVEFMVKDERASSVDGATIVITDVHSKDTTLTTNEQGVAITNLKNGNYTFKVIKEGFDVFTGDFTVADADQDLPAITLRFMRYNLTLVANPAEGGTITQSGSGQYYAGEPVQVDATANSGYQFLNWTWDGLVLSSIASYSALMPAEDGTLTANFVSDALRLVTFTVMDRKTNEPIFGAEITISGQTVKSGMGGVVNIALADGDYEYKVSMAGYADWAGSIKLQGSDIGETVKMRPINVQSLTLNHTSQSIFVSETLQLTATITPSGANQNVMWSTSNASIAKVDEHGLVTGVAAGAVTITATSVTNPTKKVSCTITVNDFINVTGVSLSESSKTIKKGESFALTHTVQPSNATNQNVSWSSSDATIATVDNNGKVTGVKKGKATITVTTQDGNKTATCVVTVESTEVSVTGVSLSETTKTIKKGESFILTATVSPSDATNPSVTWSSDDESVATVSGGKVSALKAGVATITVKTVDGGKTATCRVTVEDATPVDAAALHLTLFPNPASSQVGIVGLSSPADVAIYNSLGGVVLSVFVQPNQSIDVSALPAGVYLLRVEGVVLRFVKE